MNKQSHTIIIGGIDSEDRKANAVADIIAKYAGSGADIRRIPNNATHKTIVNAGKRVTPTRRTLVVIEDVRPKTRLIKKSDSYVEDKRYDITSAVNELLATAESGVHVVITAGSWTTNSTDIIAA